MRWHAMSVEDVTNELKADPVSGLTASEAAARLARCGRNQLAPAVSRSRSRILLSQLSSSVVLLLMVSAAVSALLGDVKNVVSIAAIVALDAALGFTQEVRAERALDALRRHAAPVATVRREGRRINVSSADVVPGDLVILESGNRISADGRVIESVNLRTQEAALTGESDAVAKTSAVLSEDRPLPERANMGYAGTFVATGRGLLLITETGMSTELGRIAAMMGGATSESTPLQRRLNHVGNRLALAALAIVAVIFAEGLVRGEELKLMFLTAVSIAVAAVPEGLPAIVTINLALGAQRMLARNALIRRLPAVETLGSVTVICTDKTGTLTENRMSVAVLDVADHRIDLRPLDSGGRGGVSFDMREAQSGIDLLLMGGTLCNDVVMEPPGREAEEESVIGDPMEAALASAGARFGHRKPALERVLPRVHEMPFDPIRKRMTTVHSLGKAALRPPFAAAVGGANASGAHVAFSKGSVDSLLTFSTRLWADGRQTALTVAWIERITTSYADLWETGMFVIGVAFRVLPAKAVPSTLSEAELEADFTFVGLVGLMDPLRPEAREAVQACRAAGIKPVMITGDHPMTAAAIARALGFGDMTVLTGADLDRLPAAEWPERVAATTVFARVSPEHKLKIVEALQSRGEVVAMTGDGVNDAPALQKADIGVAMGRIGTDVAKEAADMVLLDDNFATIVAAVKEGRVIYENIRKFLRYLLSGNVGEIAVMFLSPWLGMPMALLPVQILWINLITDGLPALALGMEPAEGDVMRRPPVSPRAGVFAGGMASQILWIGGLVAAVPLALGAWSFRRGDPTWQTLLFTMLIAVHVEMALALRSERASFFQLPLGSNVSLLGSVVFSLALQVAVVRSPALRPFFGTSSMSALQTMMCLAIGSSVFWVLEAEKWGKRRSTEPRSSHA